MLEILRKELEEYDIFSAPNNELVNSLVRAVPFTTVPLKMKAVMAISHITNFAGQFRRNIELWDGTEVPINGIAFVISGSGDNKDSSNSKIRGCFKPGFELIRKEVEKTVKSEAIRLATAAGEEVPTEFAFYKDYLKPIPPIFTTITTGPGLIQHINDIGDLPLSSTFMYSGEISDELAYNPNAVENIKILSEVYDLGVKEATYTKGVEFRSKEIDGQPVSALFVGSPGHILYDEATKKKFHVAFMSKLARRSWFCYAPETIEEPTFSSGKELIKYRIAIELEAKEARAAMSDVVLDVTKFALSTLGTTIPADEEVFELFEIYKRYNREVVGALSNQESTYALIRRHLQWKALKLAGAFALMDKSNELTVVHYVEAMKFCELLDKDMEQFEYDLNKAPHERFSDYARTLVRANNKAVISIHDIKKHGFTSNVSRNKLQELVKLCAGYDTNGIYSLTNEDSAIQYEPIMKTDVLGISYKPIDNTALNKAVATGDLDIIRNAKHDVSVTTAYGFEVADTTFEELGELLTGDFAYSPFKFRNGVRGKSNIEGPTKWLVLDIDDSLITSSEAHFMLSDINHHIALSSDASNEYKFRVLIELDSPVELTPIAWKHFYLEIANDLALKVDPLPQSQIFFSYADRPVLSLTGAEPLEVRDYVMNAIDKSNAKDFADRSLTNNQRKAQLSDTLETFNYAFNSENGTGSRNMIRAAYHARDLGATRDEAVTLVEDINDYWIQGMPLDRLDKILDQVRRLFNGN